MGECLEGEVFRYLQPCPRIALLCCCWWSDDDDNDDWWWWWCGGGRFWSLTFMHPPVRAWAVLKEFAERKERVFYLEPQTFETIHEINWNSFENFFVHLGSCCVKMWKRRKLLWDSPSEHLDHRSLSRKRQTCFWSCHQSVVPVPRILVPLLMTATATAWQWWCKFGVKFIWEHWGPRNLAMLNHHEKNSASRNQGNWKGYGGLAMLHLFMIAKRFFVKRVWSKYTTEEMEVALSHKLLALLIQWHVCLCILLWLERSKNTGHNSLWGLFPLRAVGWDGMDGMIPLTMSYMG